MSFLPDLVFEGTALPLARTELTRRARYTFTSNGMLCKQGGELTIESLSFNGVEQWAMPVRLVYFAPEAFGVRLTLPELERGQLVIARFHNPTREPIRFHLELGRAFASEKPTPRATPAAKKGRH
jgi:hypothetical protein